MCQTSSPHMWGLEIEEEILNLQTFEKFSSSRRCQKPVTGAYADIRDRTGFGKATKKSGFLNSLKPPLVGAFISVLIL